MRALLDLVRTNQAAAKDVSTQYHALLLDASGSLDILDPELGEEEELIMSVAAELARLSQHLRKPNPLNPNPHTLYPKP